MDAIAWRITNEKTGQVLLEGIVTSLYDTIYPAQEEPYLKEEFPELPYEVELKDFKVEGLQIETLNFEISWEQVANL